MRVLSVEAFSTNRAKMTQPRPWLRYYGKVPHSLSYPEITLYDAVAATAARLPDAIAWDLLDMTASYRAFLADIDACANTLAALGVATGERILISMPTSAQGVIAFYAANKLGTMPALIHPLSTTPEIEHYLNASGARVVVTLDAGNFPEVPEELRRPFEALREANRAFRDKKDAAEVIAKATTKSVQAGYRQVDDLRNWDHLGKEGRAEDRQTNTRDTTQS